MLQINKIVLLFTQPMNQVNQCPCKEAMRRHQCGQCIQNETILQKYKKLVDLLYKKIKQLQKKNRSQLTSADSQKQPDYQAKKSEELQSWFGDEENLPRNISNPSFYSNKDKQTQEARTKESFMDEAAKQNGRKQLQMTEIQKLQKVSFVINGLTEQVMQLKSNFMHIRHCVYAFVKELNIGDKINSNPVILNIALTLISIFEFSENEKEEMFNHKKVKLRKKQKNKNKENVFVTIKEI